MEGRKKLYKSSKEKVICGVCGGLAEYFGLEVSLVRLAWILFTCLGGSGLLAYILAAIVIPSEKIN